MAHEGEGDAAEVAAAAEAGDDHIGIFAGLLHLLLGFKADDGLMDGHVVEHRAQRVLTVRCGSSELHGFRDGRSQRAGMAWVAGDDILTGTCRHRGGTCHSSTKRAHDGRAVGLLLHGDLHLIDGSLQSEHRSRIAQRCTPLAGTRLCGDVGGAFLLSVVALGQGRVDLVRAQRVHRLVLEVDVGRCSESFFQRIGTHQRRGAVVLVLLQHLFGDGDEGMLLVEFLHATLAWEDVCEIVHAQRLLRSGMDGRQRLVGHVSLNVVPCRRHLILLKDKSFLFHNGFIFNVIVLVI